MLAVRVLVVAAVIALAGTASRAETAHAATRHAAPARSLTAVPAVANAFATVLLETVIGGFKDEAVSAGFGSLLGFIGLDGEPAATAAQVEQIDARVKRVEDAIAQVSATVNETKRNVDAARIDITAIKDATLRAEYNQSASEASRIVNHIDSALRKIQAANAAKTGPSGDATRRDAENYVSEYVDGAAERLQAVVFGDARGISGTPLVQSAFGAAASNDFLTHAESVHVRYLVDLYTTYESLAAAITGEYRRARQGYPEPEIKTYLEGWLATVKEQQAQRRDAVPQGAVVDARTLRMWSVGASRTNNPSGAAAGPGYSDWSVPSTATYQSLVAGYARTPKEFLQGNGFDVQGDVVITSDRKDYTACRPGFASLDLAKSPPTAGTAYSADPGGCKQGTHGGQTTYQTCKKVRAGKGGVVNRCTTQTDQQQVTYNARLFGSNHLFFAVRKVAVGAFLPPSYPGTP